MSDDPSRAKAIFLQAIQCSDPAAREVLLREQCGTDPALREQVDILLEAHAQAGSFLELGVFADSATIDQPLAERPGTQIGPYHILEQLGEGGMGVVFRAEQQEPVARQVALKVIKPGMDTRRVIDRFEAERLALAVMDHPHVAKVLDAGSTDSGRPYFVMELVQGVAITAYCDDHELSVRERLELFIPVCQAVQHAHQKGIIHRDIKPSNILVAEFDGRPVPKVIDFGVAKAIDQGSMEKTTFTLEGQIVGTPEYMSPEQAQSRSLVDTRSDVYSLGVVLYELLTGDTPLDRKRLRSSAWDEITRMIREEEPPTPSKKLSSSDALPSVAARRHVEPARLSALVRGELDWIVMKALDKDRARRYESPSALARDIEHHLHDQPVLAGPPSAGYRFRKFARRNKRVLATIGLLALAMIVGTAASVYQAVRATRAERLAETRLEEVERQRDAARQAEAKADLSRREAERAREAAEQAQRKATAVARYLVEVFRSPDPERDGRTITVAEVLDQARSRVEEEFREDRVLQGQLLRAIGETYMGLGLIHEGTRLLEKSRDLLRDTVGTNHAETLGAMHHLAEAYLEAGRRSEALPLAEETLRLRQEMLGAQHPDTLESLSALTLVYIDLGRLAEALPLAEEALRLSRATFGPEHRNTLMALNNLAGVHYTSERYEEALRLLKEVAELTRKVLGPNHIHTITSMNNLAAAYSGAGQFEAGLRLAEELLPLSEKVLGGDHPDTLQIRNNLANSYIEVGRTDEGIRLHEETLRLYQEKLGPEHPHTLGSMANLAGAYGLAGRWADAVRLRARTLLLRNKVPPGHPDTLFAQVEDAAARMDAGQDIDESEQPQLLDSLLKLASLGGPMHREILDGLEWGSRAWVEEGKLDDAASLMENVLRTRRKTQGSEHPDTLQAMIVLANIQVQRAEYAAAEPLLLEAHEGIVQRLAAGGKPDDEKQPQAAVTNQQPEERFFGALDDDETQLRAAVTNLVQLYEKTNQPEKANAWRVKLIELKRE
ncbi:MAG: serine/threonine protein kinase [Planctomycetes bacterium]|nr:serine/threonine protein kinase [Planctomycetota bacterium]